MRLSIRHFSKNAGLFQPPPKMVEKIWQWVLPRYAALVFQTTKDIKLKEMSGKDCNFTPEQYYDFTTTIPISLEDWKYLDENLQNALKNWQNIFSEVKVAIYSVPDPEFVGRYIDSENTIDIILDRQWLDPSLNHYNRIKYSLYRNVEHEVIHLGQYIFKHFKNIGLGGIPSKRISDPTYTPEGFGGNEKEYSTKDIEFYAILNDAKRELQKYLTQWPQDMHDSIFKQFVGIIPSYQIHSLSHNFFVNLKKLEPEKWQKATKELYKILSDF